MGCKHGHEAHSCTACAWDRRMTNLEDERDALRAQVQQLTDQLNDREAAGFQKASADFVLQQERDALRARVAELEADNGRMYDLSVAALAIETERDELAAVIERVREVAERNARVHIECGEPAGDSLDVLALLPAKREGG